MYERNPGKILRDLNRIGRAMRLAVRQVNDTEYTEVSSSRLWKPAFLSLEDGV